MVSIQPIFLILCQHFCQHGFCINGAISNRLKAIELSVLGFLIFFAKQLVFNANAQFSLFINTRLVGNGHARYKRCCAACRKALRAFVNTADKADAMSCAAAIIQAFAPHRFTRQNIQMHSGHAVLKHRTRNINMAFQHQSVIALFFFRQFAGRISAGNVRGAVAVLCAGIHQQEAVLFNDSTSLGFRCIVHHGRIAAIGCNRVKAFAQIVRLNRTGCTKPCIDVALCHALIFGQLCFQPNCKAHHRHTVFHMGIFEVFDFRFVFNTLQQCNRLLAILQGDRRILLHGAVQMVGKPCLFVHHRNRFCNLAKHGVNLVVLMHFHALLSQIGNNLLRHTAGVNKQHRFLRQHQAIGHCKGVVGNIACAQV